MVEQFELYGCELAEGALAASAVVGAFDPGDDRDAELVSGVPGLALSTFFCSSERKDSMAALSPAAPTWPIEPSIP